MQVVKFHNTFNDLKEMCEWRWGNNPRNAIIVLGYQIACPIEQFRQENPGKEIIVYQFEQLHDASPWNCEHVLNWLKNADEIWDYDPQNIQWMNLRGISAKFTPLMFTPNLNRIQNIENPDIDILFYGYCNQRRFQIISEVTARLHWMKTYIVNAVYGDELDQLIGRSKVVVNIHAYDFSPQEQARLFYLAGNAKCIISEKSPRNFLGDAIIEADREILHSIILHHINTHKWKKVAADEPTNLAIAYDILSKA